MDQTPPTTPIPLPLSAELTAALDELVPYLCQLTKGRINNRLEAAHWLLELATRDAHRDQRQVEIMAGAFAALDDDEERL